MAAVMVVMIALPPAPDIAGALVWPRKELVLAKHQVLGPGAGVLSVETKRTGTWSGISLELAQTPALLKRV